jgi:hypothetical protein
MEMVEEPYRSEDELQKLLEHHPELLDRKRSSGARGGLVLIGRELPLASEPDS